MKRFLVWAIVPAVVAFALLAYFRTDTKSVPAIAVEVGDPSSGGTDFLPAEPGYVSGVGHTSAGNGSTERYRTDQTFTVASSSPGHLFVLAHYRIVRQGLTTEYDVALPVYDRKPDPSHRANLGDDLTTCAYLAGTTLNR